MKLFESTSFSSYPSEANQANLLSCLKNDLVLKMSHIMRKPVYDIKKQKRRSARASAQSDQHLCCSLPT